MQDAVAAYPLHIEKDQMEEVKNILITHNFET